MRVQDGADLEALTSALNAARIDCEVWTTNVRLLCKQCSEGTPHEHVDEEVGAQAWPDSHVLGISTTTPDAARQVLEQWSTRGTGAADSPCRQAGSDRLLRFERALAGAAVH